MRLRVLDLETAVNPKALDWLEPVKPDSRLRDPEKIKASIEEKTSERNEKLALDWDCCRIVALGWVDVGSNDPWCEVCENEDEEKSALTFFWKTYSQQPTRLVTFNGLKFDLPVLLTRSIDLEVPHPEINLDRFRSKDLDVWQWLTRNGARQYPHSLSFYSKKYGFTTLDKVDGKDIGKLVEAKDWESIRQHCLSDVGLCHAVAARLGLLPSLEPAPTPEAVGAF